MDIGKSVEAVFRDTPVLIRAFYFDNATKQWQFYAPRVQDVSTLTEFRQGEPYWLLVSGSVRTGHLCLSCLGDNCWNVVVW